MPDFLKENQVFVSLDTSYSKFQIDFKSLHKKIKFIPIENIDHNTKKTNKESFNFYLDQYLPNLNYSLVKKLYCENEQIPIIKLSEDFIFPLEIYENYSHLIDKENNEGLLFFSEKNFLRWYHKNKRNNNYIFMVNEDKKHLKKIINRFDKKYQNMIKNRMNWLMYKYGNENACSITLTLNPSNFRNDKLCMWETINLLLNEFITELRAWYKKRGKPFPKYIRCIEAMKGVKENDFVGRGNPHIHMCLFGVKYIPKSVINRFWTYGFSYVNSTAKNQKVRYPIHYVTKYITKTYTENDPDNTLNQSLVWFFNKKSFEHSRNLVYPMYSKGSSEWNFEYYVSIEPLNNEFEEMDFIFQVEENLYKHPPPIMLNHGLHEGVIL